MSRRGAVVALALALTTAGCGGGGTPEPELQPGVLRVGVIADLASPRDAEIVDGARVAVTELDNQGGVDDVLRLRLVVRSAGTPRAAAGAARALLAGGVGALVLPCEPVLQAAAAAVSGRRGALAIAPCNSLPRLWHRFRFAWPAALGANQQAEALAAYLADQKYRAVGILGRGALVRYLRRAVRARGLAVGGRRQAIVIGPGTPNAYGRAAAAVTLGVPVYGTDALESARSLRRYGRTLDGLVLTTFGYAEPGDPLDEFDVRYLSLFGRQPDSSSAARGYDAARVLAVAVDAAQSTRGRDVSAELADGLDVHGALGTISYRGRGRRSPDASVAIVQVEDRRLALVDRVDM